MILYFNDVTFDASKFDDKRVTKASSITFQQISQYKPTFFQLHIQTNKLEDETALINFMQDEQTFYGIANKNFNLQDSAWDHFPTTEKPFNQYKYLSFDLQLNKSLHQISRQTYSLLEWLGDCGGLMDALIFLSKLIISPFSVFALWK